MRFGWSAPSRGFIVSAILALAASGVAHPAAAETEMIDNAFSTCTTVNCSGTSFAGYVGSVGGSPQPWVAKVLAIRGLCLRLEATLVGDGVPLEMVVVSPDPRVRYRSVGANLPLVKIDPAPASGFYTVVVTSPTGAALDTDFHFQFGHYNGGNPNCASPTTAIR